MLTLLQFYAFTPVPMDDLPPFRLCHPVYWEDEEANANRGYDFNHDGKKSTISEIRDVERNLVSKIGASKAL